MGLKAQVGDHVMDRFGYLAGRDQDRADDLNEAFTRFKELADRKRDITDRDLEAIVSEQVQQPEARFQLRFVQVSCTRLAPPCPNRRNG